MFPTARVINGLATLVFLGLAAIPGAALAQDKPPAGGMSKEQQAIMDAMTKAMTPGDNHKLLASLVGDWTFVNRMWMDPSAPPTESNGTASYTMVLGGRYLQSQATGMMMGMPFEGMGTTGYDNVSRQFQASWVDNFGTMIMYMTGKYDPAAKAFSYVCEMDDAMKPGTKVKVRQVIRLVDPNKHVMEWYETRGGKEAKTMEIVSTRKN
jgi:hypothetical protein